MRSTTADIDPGAPVDARWQTIFEDRYGADGLDRLLQVLRQPCVTFAAIAKQFGVTRECVRQWHLLLLPGDGLTRLGGHPADGVAVVGQGLDQVVEVALELPGGR